MPTPEEIKNLAELYADKECEQTSLEDKELLQFHEDKILEFYDVMEFLLERYCIVPKSKVKEWEGIVENALKADPVITEPAFRFMWERLFGKDMFEEGKK